MALDGSAVALDGVAVALDGDASSVRWTGVCLER